MTTSRLTLIALVLVISSVGLMRAFESHASTCIITKEMMDEWSYEYKDRVRIEISKHNKEYFVEAFFPPEIEGQILRSVWLFKGTPAYDATRMDYDFSMGLEVRELEDGSMYSAYELKAKFAKDNYISASYGESCGIGIQYRIDFGKSVEK